MFLALVYFILICSSGNLIAGDVIDSSTEHNEASRPSNIRMRTGEEFIEIHWDPPSDIDAISFCIVEYKPTWAHTVPLMAVPIDRNIRQYTIAGLERSTSYKLRLCCYFGNERGSSTEWFHASTRTVSVEDNICPGTLPNAFLELSCIDRPSLSACHYTCADGYRQTGAPSKWMFHIDVKCKNGSWVISYASDGFKIEDICLPEADFQKCPLSIPNGRLERFCGPATDWLCEFQCNDGYDPHPFIGVQRFEPKRLLCNNGHWTTGYEDIGLDIAGVCILATANCPLTIPHGNVDYRSSISAYNVGVQCTSGYRKRAIAANDVLTCNNGTWVLKSTAYDHTITPETLCILNDTRSICQRTVPNGRIPHNCEVSCTPVCNHGYRFLGRSSFYDGVTCEDGVWTSPRFYNKPYTIRDVCFPNEGIYCSEIIQNGKINASHAVLLRDDGNAQRISMDFRCNDGFRKHRGIPYVECVAGRIITWQERYGIDSSKLCFPI